MTDRQISDSKDSDNSISLKEYFNQRLSDLDKAIEIALSNQEKATEVAYETMEKRLSSMNEFRDTLRDQAAKFTTREELNLIIDRLEQDIKNLEVTRSQMLTISVYDTGHKELQKQVDDLKISRALLEGKATQESVNSVGSKAQWAIVFGAIGTVLAVVNFITRATGH